MAIQHDNQRGRRRGRIPASLLALSAVALYVFVRLARYAGSGEPHAWDSELLVRLRSGADSANPIGAAWFEELVRDVTAFGGVGVLLMITLGVAGYLTCVRRHRTALFLVLSVLGGVALSFGLKELVGRARPDLVPHSMRVYTNSFPSGHSTLAAVTYLTLGAIVANVQAQRGARIYVLAVAAGLTFLVGASRVYLGVHWPSDVLAGFALGVAWACLAWVVESRLQQRGEIEPPPSPERSAERGPLLPHEAP